MHIRNKFEHFRNVASTCPNEKHYGFVIFYYDYACFMDWYHCYIRSPNYTWAIRISAAPGRTNTIFGTLVFSARRDNWNKEYGKEDMAW